MRLGYPPADWKSWIERLTTRFLFCAYVIVDDQLNAGWSTFVVCRSTSTPLFDILPIGKNCLEKPVLVGSGRKKSRSDTRRSYFVNSSATRPARAPISVPSSHSRARSLRRHGLPYVSSLTKPGRPANGSWVNEMNCE